MSFGSLKTLKLERTLGDAVLSITTHVPIDASNEDTFDELDLSIVKSASMLREHAVDVRPSAVPTKAEEKQAIPEVIKEVTTQEEKPVKKPNKKGGGRPKGTTKKVEEKKVEPTLKPASAPKKVADKIETLADQDEKVALVQKFQESFETEVGFESEDTYMDEFNSFMSALVNMDYKTFLEADITEAQLKTFADLI